MRRPGEGVRRVEQEIAHEKAATLGRAGERLQEAVARLEPVAAALARTTDPDARARLGAQYEALRARVLQTRLTLVTQREAVGLRRHRILDEHFPEPPPLRDLA
jgi:hypothetical protein